MVSGGWADQLTRGDARQHLEIWSGGLVSNPDSRTLGVCTNMAEYRRGRVMPGPGFQISTGWIKGLSKGPLTKDAHEVH